MSTGMTSSPQPRARSEAAQDLRAVRIALAEASSALSALQSRAALLHAQLGRTGKAGALAITLVGLTADVSAAGIAFDQTVAGLPERQQQHGRVADLARAFARLRASLPPYSAD
jgi:hypothetical protein